MNVDSDLQTRLRRYLQTDLIAQLPDAHALTTAIRRVNSIYQAIHSFVPQYIADNERLYTEDYSDLRPGTFMFSDVSGFTALSEKVQQQGGSEGIDILTEVINSFFSAMLEILAKSNGMLLKFAGDALLTFFPTSPGTDEAPLAIRTGLRMQREMAANFQPINHLALEQLFGNHDLELTMSIGICQGLLFECVVGNEIQRDHIIQGDLPGAAMDAEAVGERDDVIITAALQAAHADKFDTVPVGDGFFRVIDNFGDELGDYEFTIPSRRRAQTTALFGFDEENLLEDLERNLERLEGVSRFIAREVVDKLAFSSEFRIEGDNRRSTTIFAQFVGFADMLHDWGEEQLPLIVSLLGRYYNMVQRAIAANGGVLTRSDPYGRGVKLLITFGAPIAHSDDPERAVTTALEMNRLLAQFNARLHDELPDELQRETYVQQRIGITHGAVFTTEAGWQSRREYTVMGDDVNLAARFMSKAEMGQIIISRPVWDRVNAHFEVEELPPFYFKGKSEPIPGYLVKASTASPLSMSATSDTPFIGRHLQLLAMTYALQQAKGPRRPQYFALQGDIGVGKTRMAKQVVEAAEDAHFQVAWANCYLSHSQRQSVWPAIIFQLLELEQAKSESAQRRLLHVRLAELGLTQLEAIFSIMLFGSANRPSEDTQPNSVPVVAEQPGFAAQTAARDRGAEANPLEALTTTGVFGVARDQLRAAIEASVEDTHEFETAWQEVQRQTNISSSIAHFVSVYADTIPTLIVIDDLHRADQITLTILAEILETIKRARLMMVVTYEPAEHLNLKIRRKINVGELDADETKQVAAHLLETREIDQSLFDLVWSRTNGRPLFVESLLHLLEQDDHIERTNLLARLKAQAALESLPDDVRELITSQIDRLSPEARALLQTAATLGDGFTADALLYISDGLSEIRLETLLGELLHAEIVELMPDNTYRFRHGLTEMTVYESLNRLQRQKLHRAAAEYLQQLTDDDRHVLKIAYHLVKGGRPIRGIEIVSESAGRAEQEQRLDRAIELYTHACDIFPHDDSMRAELKRLQALLDS